MMSLLCEIGILFLTSAFILCYDIKNPIHFISTGYGSSVLVQSIVMFCMNISTIMNNKDRVSVVFVIIHTMLNVLYGYRLASFFFKRSKNENYQASQKPFTAPFYVALIILVYCSALYVLMVSPLLLHYHLVEKNIPVSFGQIIGSIIMLSGIIIEATADSQKSEFKSQHPTEFCSTGLFRYLRMANYFGELVFWTGNYITSWCVPQEIYFLIANFLGWLMIVGIMFHSAMSLDKKHMKCYGSNAAYLQYRKTTRILLPFIPFYEFGSKKQASD